MASAFPIRINVRRMVGVVIAASAARRPGFFSSSHFTSVWYPLDKQKNYILSICYLLVWGVVCKSIAYFWKLEYVPAVANYCKLEQSPSHYSRHRQQASSWDRVEPKDEELLPCWCQGLVDSLVAHTQAAVHLRDCSDSDFASWILNGGGPSVSKPEKKLCAW
jgi:hypothetical protein